MNLNWPRYLVTPNVSVAELRRHAERCHARTGTPQLIVHLDGSLEQVPAPDDGDS